MVLIVDEDLEGRSNHLQNVRAFLTAIGAPVPDRPELPDVNTRVLAARLLLEECMETIEALGVQVWQGRKALAFDRMEFDTPPMLKPDLVKVIDGAADVSVITRNIFTYCGVKDNPIIVAVDDNNLLKIKTGRRCPKTGKWKKAHDHPKPDIAGLLKQQGWEGN